MVAKPESSFFVVIAWVFECCSWPVNTPGFFDIKTLRGNYEWMPYQRWNRKLLIGRRSHTANPTVVRLHKSSPALEWQQITQLYSKKPFDNHYTLLYKVLMIPRLKGMRLSCSVRKTITPRHDKNAVNWELEQETCLVLDLASMRIGLFGAAGVNI